MGHDDVPKDIREQLYAEEQQWRECQSTRIGVPTPSLLPINITNFLPTQPMSLACPASLKTLRQPRNRLQRIRVLTYRARGMQQSKHTVSDSNRTLPVMH
jgi:hypothetical protein